MRDKLRSKQRFFGRLKSMGFQVRQQWQGMVESEASAGRVARSFALGTFIGLVPVPGVEFVLTVVVLKWFRQVERLPLLAAMALWNNIVSAPLYAAGYKVGEICIRFSPFAITENISHAAVAWTLRFAVGNLIMAVVTAIASYFVVRQGLGRIKPAAPNCRPAD